MLSTKSLFENENMYVGETIICGIHCEVGYIKKFKWAWMATQLNTFVIVGRLEKNVDKQTMEAFSHACVKYAIANNKGWPRGLQSAVGAVAVLQAPGADQATIDFCSKLSKKHWSAFEIPVFYNTTKKEAIRFQKNPAWGAIYMGYFKNTIDNITSKMS